MKTTTMKLKCIVRVKPKGDDEQSGIQNFNSTHINVDNQQFGPFTSVIGPQDTQSETFERVMGPLIESFNSGINATVFMYGQTGSGKTHSLFGPPKFFNYNQDAWGVCPRAIEKIIGKGQVTISVVEIYFDDCFDLLNSKV